MFTITNEDLLIIARYMKEYLELDEYFETHLTYQLAKTTKITTFGENVSFLIPAPTYDAEEFIKRGVIVYDNKGSYANENDIDGGFSGKHVGYVERVIEYAIKNWVQYKGIDESEVEIRWN